MARPLKVKLSEFVVGAIARGEPRDSEQVGRRFGRAIRFYLGEATAGRAGWSVPSTLRGGGGGIEVSLELDDGLLRRLEAEARKQDVSPASLVSQAAIYYAAELDAGRITQRVLDDLEDDSSESASF